MNNYFPQEIIDEIRINNDIIEVISEYVQLKKRGRNFFGNCPFHNEKTPSMSVSPEKQIFHCFGCGEGGNVISFIMKIENIDFVETIKLLADRAKIQLPEQNVSDEYKKNLKLKEDIFNVNKEAAKFFYNNLMSKSGEKALNYLSKRGIESNSIKKFGLGYSLNEFETLNKHLLSKGYSQYIIEKACLARKSKNGNYIDYFRNRIMFPIFDVNNNVIGFGGRAIDDQGPKYLNTSETIAFNKGNNLYALNFAKKSKRNNIIIAEGYMDVLSMHQYGIDCAVATLGTALTDNQARLLRKYTDEVIIAYDSDDAGQTATMRSIDILEEKTFNIKVLQVPDGKDPDEFLRNNDVNKFIYLINHSMTYMEFKINLIKKQYNLKKVDDKIKFLSRMSSVLAKIDNTIERDAYIEILSKESGISEESIVAQINRILNNSKNQMKKVLNNKKLPQKNDPIDSKLDYAEKLLIYLLTQDNIFEKYKDNINVDTFIVSENKKIAELVLNKLNNNLEVDPSELMLNLDEKEVNSVSKAFSRDEQYDDLDKAVTECLNYINKYKKQSLFNQILNSSESSDDDVEKIKQLDKLIRTKEN